MTPTEFKLKSTSLCSKFSKNSVSQGLLLEDLSYYQITIMISIYIAVKIKDRPVKITEIIKGLTNMNRIPRHLDRTNWMMTKSTIYTGIIRLTSTMKTSKLKTINYHNLTQVWIKMKKTRHVRRSSLLRTELAPKNIIIKLLMSYTTKKEKIRIAQLSVTLWATSWISSTR